LRPLTAFHNAAVFSLVHCRRLCSRMFILEEFRCDSRRENTNERGRRSCSSVEGEGVIEPLFKISPCWYDGR
jgi:hypothetical protein